MSLPSRLVTTALALSLSVASSHAQQPRKGERPKLTSAAIQSDDLPYKTPPQGELKLHVFYPPGWKATDKRPVIVFFFGGGWRNGSYLQFVPQSEYFASRGLVTISADYRIQSKHKTTPDKSVEDARSAVRFVRANAAKLGIDPDKLIAGGGSAGGHLAACTALVDGFDAADDPKASCRPNALVLYNPALNLTLLKDRAIPGADGKDIAKAISPTLYLTRSAPPAVIFFGTGDRMLAMGTEYVEKAKELGVRAELYTAADRPHGFFNRSPWLEATTERADRFLASLGYLTGDPTVKPKADARLKKE
jgi:acetyl esterase/lipase